VKRRSRLFNEWSLCFAVSALSAFVVGSCKAQTIGVHIATAHSNSDARDDNPGVYVVLPFGLADGRVVLGGYRNSLNTPQRRTSYYVGQAWQFGRFGLAAALVTGYQKERISVECPPNSPWFSNCWQEVGFSNSRLQPALIPSVSFPEARQYLMVTPRLSLVAFKHVAVHLSFEAPL